MCVFAELSCGPNRILQCSCKCDNGTFMEQAHRHGAYTKETLQFMERILSTSGVGEEAYMPPSLDPLTLNLNMLG